LQKTALHSTAAKCKHAIPHTFTTAPTVSDLQVPGCELPVKLSAQIKSWPGSYQAVTKSDSFVPSNPVLTLNSNTEKTELSHTLSAVLNSESKKSKTAK